MTHKEKILKILSDLGAMCDDCLSSATSVKPRQAVNMACRDLAQNSVLTRGKAFCTRCSASKIINRRVAGAEGSAAQEVPERKLPVKGKNHDLEALSEDEIKEVLVSWLEKNSWKTDVAWGKTRGIDVEAVKEGQRWVIEVKGPGSRSAMRVNYFLAILGETLQRMDDSDARYSIALPDLQQYRRLWDRLPDLAKARTNIDIMFVTIDGEIEQVS